MSIKKRILLVFTPVFLFVILFSTVINSITSNSTNYQFSTTLTGGGESSNSTNYANVVSVGVTAGVTNSTNYMNKLGFLHGIQECTSDNQCSGDNYCCNGVCQSNSCATTTTVASSGGTTTGGGGGSSGGAGGGGGAGGFVPVVKEEEATLELKDFSISKNELKYSLNLGAVAKDTLSIQNTGDVPLMLSVSESKLSDFLELSDQSFNLNPSEQKIIEITATAKRIGSYFGEISVSGGGILKKVPALLDINSEEVLFDVHLDIPQEYKKATPGSKLRMQVTLLNIIGKKDVNISVTYFIKNKQGKIIYESSELLVVDKQKSYLKEIKLPDDIQYDDYIASIEVTYAKSFAVSSELFSVIKEGSIKQMVDSIKSRLFSNVYYVLVGAIAVSISIIFIIYLKLSKSGRKE